MARVGPPGQHAIAGEGLAVRRAAWYSWAPGKITEGGTNMRLAKVLIFAVLLSGVIFGWQWVSPVAAQAQPAV